MSEREGMGCVGNTVVFVCVLNSPHALTADINEDAGAIFRRFGNIFDNIGINKQEHQLNVKLSSKYIWGCIGLHHVYRIISLYRSPWLYRDLITACRNA